MLPVKQRIFFARWVGRAALALIVAASVSGAARAETPTAKAYAWPSSIRATDTSVLEAAIQGVSSGSPTGTVAFKVDNVTITGAETVAVNPYIGKQTVAIGPNHACYVSSSGAVGCSGSNIFGQLGDGGDTTTNTPVAVINLPAAAAVSLGLNFSCALATDGTVYCWGRNFNAQLGNQSGNDSSTPVQINLGSTATQIAAGADFACALMTNQTVKCWGGTLHAQQGDGSVGGGSSGELPHLVPGLLAVRAITAGLDHACALLANGTAKCWGLNDSGQVGDNHAGGDDVLYASTVVGLTDAIGIAAGDSHTCAVRSGGGVKCWGANGSGQLGDNGGSGGSSLTPVDVVDPGITYVALAAGSASNHSCGITDAGDVRCWGDNTGGALGVGTGNGTAVTPASTNFSSANNVTMGERNTCAVQVTGQIQCSGNNSVGQFGTGNSISTAGSVVTAFGSSSGTALTFGVALFTLPSSTLTNGTYSLTVSYSGDGNYDPVDSQGLTLTVADFLPSMALLTSSGSPSASAASVTFTARIAPMEATGDVTFNIDEFGASPTSSVVTVVNGVATLTTSALADGAHTVTAVYNGDTDYYGYTTNPTLDQYVGAPSITSADNTSVGLGAGTSFGITTSAGPTPTISVSVGTLPPGISLTDNGNGTATLSGNPTAAGAYNFTLKASHGGGDGTQAFTFTVQKGNASVILSSSTSSPGVGVAVTFTATVTAQAPASGPPTGAVSIDFGDGASSGALSLSGGAASVQHAYAATGNYSALAVYGGSSDFDAPVIPGTKSITVAKASSSLNVLQSGDTSSLGQPVTFAAAISPANATGTVTFADGATTIGSANVSGGSASLITSSLSAGVHTISATYSGNSAYFASFGSNTHTVTQGQVSLAYTATVSGHSATFNFTVTAKAPATGTPTSGVLVKQKGTIIGSAALSNGAGSFTMTGLPFGRTTIDAEYAGDANFASTSTSASVDISVKVGKEERVNKHTAGTQQYPAIARLVHGYVVVWDSAGQDGSGTGVYGQLYTDKFKKSGSEFKVNTTTKNNQFAARVAALSDGDFVVVWQSQVKSDNYDIFGQRFSAKAKPVGKQFTINTAKSGLQSAPVVAGLADGGFAAAWEGPDGKGSIGVFARVFDKDSKPGKEFRANTATAGNQNFPDITGLLKGGFVITWQTAGQDGSGTAIYAQRYDAKARKAGKEFRANRTPANDQLTPAIAALSDGGFAIVFVSDKLDGSQYGVAMQRFDKSGKLTGALEQIVNTTTAGDQWEPAISALATGGFIVTWTSDDGSGYGVFGQAFNAKGVKVESELPISTATDGNQWHSAVAGFDDGEAVAVWTSDGQDGADGGIYSQRFKVPGTKSKK